MPRCGPTVDENSPLLGGASPRGAGLGFALLGKPTPSAFAIAVAARPLSLRHPPLPGGDFQESLSSRGAALR